MLTSCNRPLHQLLSIVQQCSSRLLQCTRTTPPATSSQAILLRPNAYLQKYDHFERTRELRSFALYDAPVDSLVRMYELLLCGSDEQLALEAEYFWHRKWRIAKLSDPIHRGAEQDFERERVCESLAVVLVDAFNYHIATSNIDRPQHKTPRWAVGNNSSVAELHERYPTLGNIYSFLPWRHFSFIHPPSSPGSIIFHKDHFVNFYQHHEQILSLRLFRSMDSPWASMSRLYELFTLANTQVFDMRDAYDRELEYFFMQSGWRDLWLCQLSDPRSRWRNVDVREPVVFPGIIELVKTLVDMEKYRFDGPGKLPSWPEIVWNQ